MNTSFHICSVSEVESLYEAVHILKGGESKAESVFEEERIVSHTEYVFEVEHIMSLKINWKFTNAADNAQISHI